MTGLAHDAAVAPIGWSGLVLLAAAGAAVTYLWAARRTSRRWSRWRTASWLAGCLVLAVAVDLPVWPAGEARGHMAQHLLLGMFAPLGLVLAAPVTLLLAASRAPVRRAVARVLRTRAVHVLAHPVTAAVLSTGGLYLVMLTPLYAASAHDQVLHHLVHVHYLLAGCLFAWAIAGVDPAPRRPAMATRTVVLVIASAAHAYLAKRLYAGADWLPPGLLGRDPQSWQAAAELMYYGGSIADLLLATALFAAWYRRRSTAKDRRELLWTGVVKGLGRR